MTEKVDAALVAFHRYLQEEIPSQCPIDEMQKLLDRIISALARIGTSPALLTIARHA
jgi:hypothetical protein